MHHMVLGTAGHIDHGKTSLVRALTGTNTDRLKEEKRRGITIELGFAPWQLDEKTRVSIIDVPGHERLVRTMVAGAAGMDLGILVVAADDGVMPQTREHLDILRLLGVPSGITVLTKADLVDEELLELVEEDVREAVAGTVFEAGPIIAASSKTGLGLEEIRKEVLARISNVERRPSDGPAFVPLDRVFIKDGYGTVGTGTSLRGSLQVGDPVEAFGDGEAPITGLKVRGLQALGSTHQTTSAGMRTAVNVAGKGTEHVKRGMVLATTGAFIATDACIAWIEVLHHARALEEETLSVHLGTSEREAKIIPLGTKKIEPGESHGVLLRMTRPIAAFAGQRLVLRRPGLHGQATVAGGTILDPEPPHGKGSVSLAASQVNLLRGSAKERLQALARESRARGVDRNAILRRLPPGEAHRAVEVLEKKGHLIRRNPGEEHWVDGELVAKLVHRLVNMVNAHHDRVPMSPGMVEAEVGSQLPPPERHLAHLVVESAVKQRKVVRDGTVLAVPGRGAAVDPESKALMDSMLEYYQRNPITPPFDADVCRSLDLDIKKANQLYGFMRRAGTLRKITDGLHYEALALEDIQGKVVEALMNKSELTASELKTAVGQISRKWAIPLFEFLDRQQITIRAGNVRRLHPARQNPAT